MPLNSVPLQPSKFWFTRMTPIILDHPTPSSYKMSLEALGMLFLWYECFPFPLLSLTSLPSNTHTHIYTFSSDDQFFFTILSQIKYHWAGHNAFSWPPSEGQLPNDSQRIMAISFIFLGAHDLNYSNCNLYFSESLLVVLLLNFSANWSSIKEGPRMLFHPLTSNN